MYCIYRKMFACLIVGLLAFGLTAQGDAQGRRPFDAESYFKSLDRNGDRRLEESELNARAVAYLKRIGVETDDDRISLRSIEKRIERNQQSVNEKAAQNAGQELKVPGFGVPAQEYSVSPFGSSAEGGQNEDFSESTIDQVEQVLRRYDRNDDNVIDMRERKDARWGRPDPSESDLNKDGVLTRYELKLRYHVREQEQARQRVSSRSDRSSSRSDRSSSDAERNSSSRSRTSARTASTSSSTRTTTATTSKRQSEAYEKYAKSLIKRYDKDRDNRLNEVEWKAVRRPPSNADKNRDGYVTESEYADALKAAADKRSGSTSSSKASPSKSLANVRTSPGSRAQPANSTKSSSKSSGKSGAGDLSKLDKDSDNQVQMHEFASEWDDVKLKEFYAIDKNRDGVITPAEWKAK
jgi:Ca2+-binding EF-hand superfamily protein